MTKTSTGDKSSNRDDDVEDDLPRLRRPASKKKSVLDDSDDDFDDSPRGRNNNDNEDLEYSPSFDDEVDGSGDYLKETNNNLASMLQSFVILFFVLWVFFCGLISLN